jgi:hypothetical protein
MNYLKEFNINPADQETGCYKARSLTPVTLQLR